MANLFNPNSPWSIMWVVLAWLSLWALLDDVFVIILLVVIVLIFLSLVRSFIRRTNRTYWLKASLREDFFVISYAVFFATITSVLVPWMFSGLSILQMFAVGSFLSGFVLCLSIDIVHHAYIGDSRLAKHSLMHGLIGGLIACLVISGIVIFLIQSEIQSEDSWKGPLNAEYIASLELQPEIDANVAVFELFEEENVVGSISCSLLCDFEDIVTYNKQMYAKSVWSHPYHIYFDEDLDSQQVVSSLIFSEVLPRPSQSRDLSYMYGIGLDVDHAFGAYISRSSDASVLRDFVDELISVNCQREYVVANALWENRFVNESESEKQLRYSGVLNYLESSCIELRDVFHSQN